MTPEISVLIPCYRAEQFVQRAIDSVRAQTLPAWELIVCDNASDDATWKVVESCARSDARIKAYRNASNIGPVRNWLRCAELGRGRMAALLFADDWYAPGFLEQCVRVLSDDSVGFVYSAVRIVREADRAVQVAYQRPHSGLLPTNAFLRAHLLGEGRPVPASPGCALFRRGDLLRSLSVTLTDTAGLGFLNHGAGPDAKVYLDACARYRSFAHIRDPLVSFAAHGDNLSSRPEIRASYQAANLQWVRDNAALGISRPAVRARAWVALRGDPRRPAILGPLSSADCMRIPGAILRAAGKRTFGGIAM